MVAQNTALSTGSRIKSRRQLYPQGGNAACAFLSTFLLAFRARRLGFDPHQCGNSKTALRANHVLPFAMLPAAPKINMEKLGALRFIAGPRSDPSRRAPSLCQLSYCSRVGHGTLSCSTLSTRLRSSASSCRVTPSQIPQPLRLAGNGFDARITLRPERFANRTLQRSVEPFSPRQGNWHRPHERKYSPHQS